jgi:hypothetical protein
MPNSSQNESQLTQRSQPHVLNTTETVNCYLGDGVAAPAAIMSKEI